MLTGQSDKSKSSTKGRSSQVCQVDNQDWVSDRPI